MQLPEKKIFTEEKKRKIESKQSSDGQQVRCMSRRFCGSGDVCRISHFVSTLYHMVAQKQL